MATKKSSTPKKTAKVVGTDYDRFSAGKGTFVPAGTPCPYIKSSKKRGK